MKKLFYLLFAMLFIQSCSIDDDDPEPIFPKGLGKGFYVVNQGGFTAGNASLSFFNYDTAKMTNNVFYKLNNAPLGDVAQSMTFVGDYAYIVINNSGLIYIIDAQSGYFLNKIVGLTSPRYYLPIDNQKAYISDFIDKGITVVNPNNLQIQGVIQTGKSTENMVLIGTKVFAANWSQYNQTGLNNTVQVIDAAMDKLVDSIQVVKEPNSMVVDKNNKLWVLCSGGYMNEEIPAIHCINPDNLEIIKTIYFAGNELSPEHLTINGTGDTLYYLDNYSVYRMTINDTQLPAEAFIPSGNRFYFTMGVDPNNSQIVVTDAGNYVQNGHIYRFTPAGVMIDSAQVGIIPGFIGYN
jgi:hypothetical protein